MKLFVTNLYKSKFVDSWRNEMPVLDVLGQKTGADNDDNDNEVLRRCLASGLWDVAASAPN